MKRLFIFLFVVIICWWLLSCAAPYEEVYTAEVSFMDGTVKQMVFREEPHLETGGELVTGNSCGRKKIWANGVKYVHIISITKVMSNKSQPKKDEY